ncbi:MAG: DnaB-like replicative helicase [Wendovervirus sonii]|uniref:DnaB-like replicative helicase n=1 Tax=phage Lak_Megaphage_Sonny TaxID=3109229 RepID=A0ABZ0Z2N1_9CAUD|nr:MAG: DnaB-like replicative helicase [phage Lak_Megaphage_Sonny]
MNNHIYLEIMIFFYLLKNPDLIKNYKKSFFTEPTINSIFDITKDFVSEYKDEPTDEQVIKLLTVEGKADDTQVNSIKTLWNSKGELEKYEDKWLKQICVGWGKWRSFYTSLENTIAYVQQMPQNVSYTEYEYYISKASNIFNGGTTFNVLNNEGYDFFDMANHIMKLEDTHTSGYKFMDMCLNGGFTKKGLYVIMGAPKVGKSQWLCNLAANSVKQGYDTIYITLEMSYQKVNQRIGSNLFNIPIDQYKKVILDSNYMAQAVRNFHNGLLKPAGRFYVEEFPTSSASASDIENFVLKKEAELSVKLNIPNFKFKNVFIDYLNIMRDQRGGSGDNTYTKIKNIAEDVRAMGQRNEWAVISLTQVNGNGYESTNLTMSDVSESKGLTATVDALFGIIQTTIMKASNVYYLQSIALRDSGMMGDKKKYIFDPHHLRITEDDSEDIILSTVDIPAIYRSATANELSKAKNNNFSKNNDKNVQIQIQPQAVVSAEAVAQSISTFDNKDALFL